MGPAIIRFINRLNIQTSWLRETDTCVQFLSWQQDTSQLGTRTFSGMGSWVSNNYTQAQWEFPLCLQCTPGFLCNDDSLCSRCRRGPAPSFLAEVTTAADAQRAVEILVLSPQFSQGRGDGRTDSRRQRAWWDSWSWHVHGSSDRMQFTHGKVDWVKNATNTRGMRGSEWSSDPLVLLFIGIWGADCTEADIRRSLS